MLPGRLRDWATLFRQVRGDYVRAVGQVPSILRPLLFTEKMQWRKLFELEPCFTTVSDKLAVRDFVAGRVGAGHLIPLLWSGADPACIPLDRLEPPYVLKSTHAAGQTWIVQGHADVDPPAMREAAAAWLSHCHGTAMCEPGYVAVPRQLMVERMLMGPAQSPPVEYKLYTFAGRVRVILALVVADDRIARESSFYTPGWDFLGWRMTRVRPRSQKLAPPARLAEMIGIAEALAEGFSHLRVDLYDCAEGVRVGELTLYTWSGHEPYCPDDVNGLMGRYWPVRWPVLRAAWTVLTKRHPVRPRLSP